MNTTTTARPTAAKFKLRSSMKLVIGFVVLASAYHFGTKAYSDYRVNSIKLPPLVPGESVNVVGIESGRGYQIRVSNQMAHLVEGEDVNFENVGSSDGGATEGDKKRRIPIKELLGSLRGEIKPLSDLLAIINDKQRNDSWPSREVLWTAEDIEKVLAGDATLKARLVRDLNMQLDGTPLETLRLSSFDGIVLDIPVPVKVNIGGEVKTLSARFKEPYMPTLMERVVNQYENTNSDTKDQVGFYVQEVLRLREGEQPVEDIAKSLKERIQPSRFRAYAQNAERLLSSARVIANEQQIVGARSAGFDGSDGKRRYDLTIDLTPEGRDRLWQYSKGKVGSQILLIVNNWPVAAPRVQHELAQQTLTVTQMPDEVLVRTAVEAINNRKK